MRLGILTSHPIQYQAPWFRALARQCAVKVFFAHRQTSEEQGKAGFGVAFEWDVDLLSGYEHQFLNNVSPKPGTGTFAGCDTPEIAEIIGTPTSDGRKSFDVFIVSGWQLKSYRQAATACRAAGMPVVVRGDSHLGTPRPWFKKVMMEFTHRWLLRQFDGFLTVGVLNRHYLEHFGARPEQIFSVPHFVDNDWFAAKAEDAHAGRNEMRKCWGADADTVVALFVGKFMPVKRPLDLIRALSVVYSQQKSSSNQRQVAVFVGSGDLEDELRAEANRLSVDAYFCGFKNQGQLPSYYSAADVLVMPSESETWGLVVNEAMACGIPVIVSDAVGCGPDLIENGRTGFIFPMGDIGELAVKIGEFAELKAAGHDYSAAISEKLGSYTIKYAVSGTIRGLSALKG
jgi:glycosyltransferase involved in cell wall biosynthesis